MFHRKNSWECRRWKINLYLIFSTDLSRHLENKTWFYFLSASFSTRRITKFFNSTQNIFRSPCTILMIRCITRKLDLKNLRFLIYVRIRWTFLKYLKTYLSLEIKMKSSLAPSPSHSPTPYHYLAKIILNFSHIYLFFFNI